MHIGRMNISFVNSFDEPPAESTCGVSIHRHVIVAGIATVIVIVAGIDAGFVALIREDYGLDSLYGYRDGRIHAVAGPAEGAPKPMRL